VVVGGTPRVRSAPSADRLWPALSRQERREETLEGLDLFAANLRGRVIRRRVNRHERDLARAILDAARALHDLTEAALDERIETVRQHAHRIARTNSRLDSDALREAYAVGVEAVRRTTGLTLYPEQVMGALVLRGGSVAEMATGEGKTITAVLPAALAGWTGRGVHVATVNDYLAKRDAQLCESAYARLGLRVGVLQENMKKAERRAQYDLDITYGADKQFIFDFLRDRLSQPLSPSIAASVLDSVTSGGTHADDGDHWTGQVVQRGLHAAIVDEADSVLIDEGATPAIIALPAGDGVGGVGADSAERYAAGIELARALEPERHYKADTRTHRVSLTRAGHERLAELARDPGRNLPAFWAGPRRREELVSQALSALVLHRRDDDYIVRTNTEGKREVVIVDRSTGRVLEGRQWQLGLHQAVEVKEGLDPSERRHTAARVSYQRYFARYKSLAGMTGTGWEVAGELWRTYGLRVVRVPTHRPIARVEQPDRTFTTEDDKFNAVAEATRRAHEKSQPVLVGSRSVQDSERLAGLLAERGMQCKVLNARHEAEEAAIIEGAGRAGAITVATSMAGRGTDIKLDDDARVAGGLLVLAVERNHERRVDRQLFGRSGRQGDVGEAVAFVSLDDEMIVRYGLPPLRWLARVSPKPVRSTLTRLLVRQSQRAATRRWMLIREEAGRIDAWVDLAFHQRSR
jgi:preprotein translocase subunit SecA